MKHNTFRLVLPLLCILASCTNGRTNTYMPSRDAITPGQTITVEGNQNVYGIAQKYHVSMREIIVLNNIQPPYAVKPGQSLILPAQSGEFNSYTASGAAAPGVGSAPVSGVQQSDLPPIQPSAVQSQELPPPPQTQSKVDTLGGKPPPSANAPSPVEALNAPTTQPKPVATTVASTKTDQAQATAAPTPVTPAPAVASKPTAAPAAPVSDDSSSASPIDMVWPVQGTVLSGFGPKGQGLNNDGVNIGAPKGAPVVAAANGIVVYAGNEMKGFGNLVLIRHQNGWVTAYAHLDRTLVTKDAVVAQGDMIGTVGKTGNVGSPQLHFETRYKDKPVDPNTLIKEQ